MKLNHIKYLAAFGLSLLLAGCQVGAAQVPSPTVMAAPRPTQAVPTLRPTEDAANPPRPTLLPNLAERVPFEAQALPAGLDIRVFQLNQPILAEEVGFEQVWAALKGQSRWVELGQGARPDAPDILFLDSRIETDHLKLGQDDLYAVLETTDKSQTITHVYKNQQPIYETASGVFQVRPPLVGLWTYGAHWALEVLDGVVIDGQAVNASLGYQKSYEFHLLGGQPAFLFEKGGQLGINFAGQEALLGGQSAPHYNCCSGALLNPRRGANLLVFFMQQGEGWDYVEVEVQRISLP